MTLDKLLNNLYFAHEQVQKLGRRNVTGMAMIEALDALELAETALRNYVEAGQE